MSVVRKSYPFSFFGYGSTFGMQSQQISENLVGFLPQENLTFLQLLLTMMQNSIFIQKYEIDWVECLFIFNGFINVKLVAIQLQANQTTGRLVIFTVQKLI